MCDTPGRRHKHGREAMSCQEGANGAEQETLEGLLSQIGTTALLIAEERALESEREDALFRDPFARRLAGTAGKVVSAAFAQHAAVFGFDGWPEYHQQWVAVRTKFIDDWLREHVGDGAQLVNLGAGVCTRPLRLECLRDSSSVRVFEVDMKPVNDLKSKVLELLGGSHLCAVSIISCDLNESEKLGPLLAEQGFDASRPSLWLLEGLIMYLKLDKQKELLSSIAALAAPGSTTLINFMQKHPQLSNPLTDDKLWQAGQIEAHLTGNGWGACNVHAYGDAELDFGRFNKAFPPCPCFSFVSTSK